MQCYHVRLVATMDRYLEAPSAKQAEQLAMERCRQAVEPIGFPVTFHQAYPPHDTASCYELDSELESMTVDLLL